MSEDGLRAALGRAAGAPDGRPDLDALWHEGRGRRRRTRVRTGIAAAAVVAALVAGAAVATTGEADQDVVTGPVEDRGDARVARPPAEPGDLPITLEADAARVVDGVPEVVPGETFTVAFAGAPGRRGLGFTWESWDGVTWTPVHALFVGVGGPLPLETVRSASATPDVTAEPLALTAPEAGPGWYRVCNEVVGAEDGADGTSVRWLVACAQLRVGGEVGPSSLPPAEPEGEITLLTRTPEVASGEDVAVALAGELEGWAVGLTATWEAWDGVTWSTTHVLRGRAGDEPYALVAPVTATEAPRLMVDGIADRNTRTFATPGVEPGWYRVCVPVGFQEAPGAPPSRELSPCAQVEVTAPADPGAPRPAPAAGEPATWVVDPADPPGPGDTTVSVLVERVGCNGGITGPVLTPGVEEGDGEVIVMFTVAPGRGDCPGNAPEPATVDLGAPLGDRRLLDGTCLSSVRGTGDACDDPARWPVA